MLDAKENRVKSWGQNARRISRGHFFLAVFFRVTHDRLSERRTARNFLRVEGIQKQTTLSLLKIVKMSVKCIVLELVPLKGGKSSNHAHKIGSWCL